jgi:Rap1a immunity proteins
VATIVRILTLIVALSVIGGAAARPRAARAQSDVQWLYHRVCANYSSNDAQAFCMTYIGGVADLMQKNCEIARQRLSAGGLSNADDRRAMLSVSSDARAGYVTAGGMHAFIDWAKENSERWNLPMVEGVVEALREKWPCESR